MSSELDLSQYCFIKNRLLLSGELVFPSKEIAEKVWDFHQLSNSEKEQILPILQEFFHQSEFTLREDEEIDQSLQTWLQQLVKLDSKQKRKMAIWLSRYCQDIPTTISVLTTVLTPSEVNKKDREEQLSESASATDENALSSTPTKTDLTTKSPSSFPKTQPKVTLPHKKAPDLTLPLSIIIGIFIVVGGIFHFAINKPENGELANNTSEITPENTNPENSEPTSSPKPVESSEPTETPITTDIETPSKLFSPYRIGDYILGNRLGQTPEPAEPLANCLAKHLPLFEIYQAKGSIQIGDQRQFGFRGRFVDIDEYFQDIEEKPYHFNVSGKFNITGSEQSVGTVKTQLDLTSCTNVAFQPDWNTRDFLQQIEFYERFNQAIDDDKFQLK